MLAISIAAFWSGALLSAWLFHHLTGHWLITTASYYLAGLVVGLIAAEAWRRGIQWPVEHRIHYLRHRELHASHCVCHGTGKLGRENRRPR